MKITRTLRASFAFTLLGTFLTLIAGLGVVSSVLKPLGVLLLVIAVPVFFVSALRHLLRGILWRVGSRLFVSYLLIGVVPLPFVLALLFFGCWILAGQMAARRAEECVLRRQAQLHALARELAPECQGAAAPCEKRFEELAARQQADLPSLFFRAGKEGGGKHSLPELESTEGLAGRDEAFIACSDRLCLLAASVPLPSGPLVLAQPLDDHFRDAVERETGLRLAFRAGRFRATGKPRKTPGKAAITISDGSKGAHVEFRDANGKTDGSDFFAERPGTPVPASFLDRRIVTWISALDRPLIDLSTGRALGSDRLVFLVRTSVALEARELFAGSRFGDGTGVEAGVVVKRLVKGLGGFIVGVYLVASLLAALLVVRIARATSRLSRALQEIERGNFGYQAQLRGRDQLAGLIEGFNAMSVRLKDSVSAQAEREALEHELELARDLQRRLLPAPDFSFPGVEIAVDFRPAAAIGGDFYHFVAEGDDRLVVVIADVSGHGLPTGIVMASAKASLSALAAAGTGTADIFATLDREIRLTTEARTFVTMAHARFRLTEGELDFTNAGHIYPYRVEASGAVSSVSNPARPLGVTLPAEFRTVTAVAQPTDLWVFLSDGIVEATSPSGDVFGFTRLEEELSRGAGGAASELRDRVLRAWRAFTERDEPADDRTLIVIRIC